MKRPKHYRQQIYDYVETLLDRPLTFDEHDMIKEMISEYVFSISNMRAVLGRVFCKHEWKVDKKVQGGENYRLYVKCVKCDKHTQKKMPTRSMRV